MLRALLSLVPLVAFAAVEAWVGLREAVIAGMALVAVELAITRWHDGRWSRMALFAGVLVGVLGGLTLLNDDERFVLWSPVAGDLILAALAAIALLRGTNPVLIALEETQPDLDIHPLERRFFDGLAWRFAAVLVLHAALTAWSVDQPRATWVWVSGPVQYGLLGLQLAGEIWWARTRVHPAVDAAEAAARQATDSVLADPPPPT